LKGKSLRTKQ